MRGEFGLQQDFAGESLGQDWTVLDKEQQEMIVDEDEDWDEEYEEEDEDEDDVDDEDYDDEF